MGRRGRSGSPFSLFSFQDIITCVSGIIILITLMLAVELSQRKQATPSNATRSLVSQLEAAIEEAQAEAARLEEQLQQATTQAQSVAAVTPEALKRDLHDVNEQVRSLRSELESLETQEAAVTAADEKLQAERFNRREQEKSVADLEEASKSLEAEVKKVQQENKVYYNPRTANGKQVWLVQIEDSRMLIAAAGQKGPPKVISQTFAFSRSAAFSEWLSNRSRSQDFVFLLVRPDATEEFTKLKDLLTGRGFEIGFDLLGSEQSAVHPKDGAAFP